jgi:hypothetical protein
MGSISMAQLLVQQIDMGAKQTVHECRFAIRSLSSGHRTTKFRVESREEKTTKGSSILALYMDCPDSTPYYVGILATITQ